MVHNRHTDTVKDEGEINTVVHLKSKKNPAKDIAGIQ